MRVGPGGVFLGIFDPKGRHDEQTNERLLARALGPNAFVFSAGPALTVGLTDPQGDPSQPLLLVDGMIRLAGRATDDDLFARLSAQDLWNAYEHSGLEALQELRGEYALLLYSQDIMRGLLARDPLGMRPVFIAESQGRLLFSSEIEPLLGALPSRPAPDDVTFAHWLGIAELREPRTLFEGVSRLPAGHAVLLKQDGWTLARYWHWRPEPLLEGSEAELLQRLREQIDTSSAISLTGAHAPGLLLSGGLDSATVLASAVSLQPGRLRTYSTVFPNHPETDEARLIELEQRHFELRADTLEVHGGSVLAGTLHYLQEWGVPDISSNYFFFRPFMQRIAEDGSDLVLDGEGGDELFEIAGYLLADRLCAGRLLSTLMLTRNIRGLGSRRSRLSVLLRFGVLGALPPSASSLASQLLAPAEKPPAHLNAATRMVIEGRHDPHAWRHFAGPRWWNSLIDQLAGLNEMTGAAEHHLRLVRPWRLDKRHPLLDLDVVLLMLRLPPDLSFDRLLSRPLQRRVLEGRIPDEVRLRPHKTYFDSIRTDSLLRGDMPLVRKLLLGGDARTARYTQPEGVRQLIEQRPSGSEASSWGAHVMQLVTGECWLRQQEDPGFATSLLERQDRDRLRLTWR